MSIQLLIDGNDRTKKVSMNSIKIENVLTNKRDTCSFEIVAHQGDTYKPKLGEEVVVYDSATKIFGGVITAMDSSPEAFGVISHKVACQDYTRLLDKKIVPDGFTNQTVDYIIGYLKTQYFPRGFTTNNVVAPVTIKNVNFNYRPVSKCLDDLARLINYDWYVDYDKDVHFFAKESVVAPFSLTDSNGKYEYDTLVIRRDNSQVRNSVLVRGGEYIASQATFDIQTNGVDYAFPLPYKFSDFEATLTGTHLHLGIDNINDPDQYDALYNFQEKILKFKDTDTPSSGKTMRVAGKPYLPVIVRYRSSADIASMASAESNATFTSDGIYETLIQDKSIKSKEGARQRAQAEVLAYANTLSEGSFTTRVSGLKAGQSIDIQSTTRDIDETFIINKVTITQWTKDQFVYNVSLITTRTFDLIETLQALLLQSTKQLEIDPNETTEILLSFDDSMTMTDSVTTGQTTTGPYKWSPGTNDFKWNFGTWS